MNASASCHVSSMDELVRLTEKAEKVVTFG